MKWSRQMIENVLGKKDNIITQSIRMKFLSCLETSLINHQMVIRGGICLGFEPLTTLRVNLLLCGHIREIPVRNRKCVKLWREQLKNCIRIHNYMPNPPTSSNIFWPCSIFFEYVHIFLTMLKYVNLWGRILLLIKIKRIWTR